MKARESGMPAEELWSTFFTPEEVLTRLGLTNHCRDAADFGCGYGTFTIPAAGIVQGTVHALDIEPEMVAVTMAKAKAAGLTNVQARQCDFIFEGTGLPEASVDYVMLFNILHAEEPLRLLREARRVLRAGGQLGIMHWNYDPATPRGPSLAIRPRPEQCRDWAERAGFRPAGAERIDLPPYHYGLWMVKP
ncbi:MAG: class I SAM-dependent methyltransferase [Candidatus Glassbacteria bacterium]